MTTAAQPLELDATLDALELTMLGGFDGGALLELTAALSREERPSGSTAERQAMELAADRLDAAGLDVRWLEHDAFVSLPGRASMRIEGRAGSPGGDSEPIRCITHAMAASVRAGRWALVDGGAESPLGLAGDTVAGRAVLVDGLAAAAPVCAWEARGAAALVFVNDDEPHEMITSAAWGSPTATDVLRLPGVPIVSVSGADGARLRERLARGDVNVVIHADVDTRWRTLPVLEATLDGPATGEDLVLLSGHVDSWHLGAMDNASANAVMIAASEALGRQRDRLRRRLRVCFWSGHSHARYAGSAWYADAHWEPLRDHAIAHVNVDSLGGSGASVLAHSTASDELRRLGAHAVSVGAGLPFVGSPPVRAGDQSFLGIGVPSLFMTLSEQPPADDGVRPTGVVATPTGGLGWWWHTPHDTMARLDGTVLERDARVYAAALGRLVLEPVVPFELEPLLDTFRGALAHAETRWSLVADAGLRDRVEALRPRVRAIDAALVRARSTSSVDHEADRNALAFGRALNPVLRTRSGPFGHDPALPTPQLPDLNDPPGADALERDRIDRRHVDVALRRGINRTLAAIRSAEVVLDT